MPVDMLWRKVVPIALLIALALAGLAFDVGQQSYPRVTAVAAADAALPPVVDTDGLIDKSEFIRLRREAVAAAEREARQRARARRAAREQAKREAEQVARLQRERRLSAYERQQEKKPRSSGGLIVGDSVSLGAERCLSGLGYRLDSEVGRQFAVGLQRLRVHAEQGFPDTVVVHLGTNGPFSSAGFHDVMRLVADVDRVVWVTIALPATARYGFRNGLNDMIKSQAAAYSNVRIADFGRAADQHPEWFFSDGVHINAAGCAGFAATVDEAVTSSVG